MNKGKTIKENKEKYTSCKVYHPNGKLMFINSQKKAKWYIKNTNATVLSTKKDGSPDKIQLTFMPKGEGFDDNDEFGLSVQTVQCVVNGEKDITKLNKHHIVPYAYRKHMPLNYKSRTNHDVVFISEIAHDEYEIYAQEFKEYLHIKYGVPNIKEGQALELKYRNDNNIKELRRIFKFINILLSKNTDIPETRLNSISQEVETYIKANGYNSLKLEEVRDKINIKIKKLDSFKIDVHQLMIEKLTQDNNLPLNEFIVNWRMHFIEKMKPKYMPIGWKVNRRPYIKTI